MKRMRCCCSGYFVWAKIIGTELTQEKQTHATQIYEKGIRPFFSLILPMCLCLCRMKFFFSERIHNNTTVVDATIILDFFSSLSLIRSVGQWAIETSKIHMPKKRCRHTSNNLLIISASQFGCKCKTERKKNFEFA